MTSQAGPNIRLTTARCSISEVGTGNPPAPEVPPEDLRAIDLAPLPPLVFLTIVRYKSNSNK